jgi:formylglycine-generating enzyme required for sulfatase activity
MHCGTAADGSLGILEMPVDQVSFSHASKDIAWEPVDSGCGTTMRVSVQIDWIRCCRSARPRRCTGDARTAFNGAVMATGPDPNKFTPIDHEMEPKDYRRGDTIGDLRSTRLGLPTWGVAVVIVALFFFFLALTF